MVIPYAIIDGLDERWVYTPEGAYVYNRIEDTYYMHKFVKMKDDEPVYKNEAKPCSEKTFRKAVKEVQKLWKSYTEGF